jgi:hypothetical protein
MPFAIVDQERDGVGAVLMIVEEEDEAEAIVFELRRHDVRVDIRTSKPEPRQRDRRRPEFVRPGSDDPRWE